MDSFSKGLQGGRHSVDTRVAQTYDLALIVEGGDTGDIGRLVLNQIHGTPGLKATMTLIAVS